MSQPGTVKKIALQKPSGLLLIGGKAGARTEAIWLGEPLRNRHLMTSAEILESLRKCSLFKDFTDIELDELIDLLDPMEFPAGETIVRQDEPGDAMYLVVRGSAKVVHHRDGNYLILAQLGCGDFFGEIALVDCGPRSADVVAVEPCVLLKVTQAAIRALAGVYPTAGFKFLITMGRILVERLRKTNKRYIDTLLLEPRIEPV